jgi:hypothetical protein
LGVFIAAGVLAACGPRSTQIGHGMFAIKCRRNQTACYDEAQKVCGPQGFDLVDQRERLAMVYAGDHNAVPAHDADLLVRCRGAFQAAAAQCTPQGFACHAQTTCCPGLSCNAYSTGWACGPPPAATGSVAPPSN